MTTIFLHIGMPKTGSTLIQAALPRLREELGRLGCWVPQSPIQGHRVAVEVASATTPPSARHDYQHIIRSCSEQVIQDFSARLASGVNVLLSSEYFFDCRPQLLKEQMLAWAPQGTSIRIAVFVRRQDRYFASSFNQEVKAMGKAGPLDWSPKSDGWLNWEKRIGLWGDSFGDDNVRLISFDRLLRSHPRPSLTGELLESFELNFNADRVSEIERKCYEATNHSLSAELLEFKRLANSVTLHGELDWLIQRATAKSVGTTEFKLPNQLARTIVDHYRDSNARLAVRFKLGESLFDEDFSDSGASEDPFTLEVLTKLVAIMAAEIGELRKKIGASPSVE